MKGMVIFMKKLLLSIILAITACICFSSFAFAETVYPSNSAKSAILLHSDTDSVLFEENADERMLIASTTKMLTALVVLENSELDEYVEIKSEYCAIEGSSMYLMPGTSCTVGDLLHGLMLASGNDAAAALACHVGGSIEGFADMMNERAGELRLENSHFVNPHGLDAPEHYSTARDLAIIASEAMKNERFEAIASTRSITMNGLTFINHNKLLWNYEGALGIKTGYTMAAGRSLVSCAERDGLRLICVTLSDPDDWSDHAALFDWGFENYRYENVLPDGELARIPVISGSMESVGVAAERELPLLIKTTDNVEILYELPRFAYAAVSAGERAGVAVVQINGEAIARAKIIYTQSADIRDGMRLSAFEKLKRAWDLANRYGGTKYGYYF